MSEKTAGQRFLDHFKHGKPSANGIIPLRFPQAMLKMQNPDDAKEILAYPKRMLIISFREVFRDYPRYKWDQDNKLTRLFIRDAYPQLSEGESRETELRPAIIIQRGSARDGLINGRTDTTRVAADMSVIVSSVMMSMQMRIQCVAKLLEEANELAALTTKILKENELVFKQRGLHACPLGLGVGEEGPFITESELGLVAVPVSFSVEYSWSYARKPFGILLNKLAELALDAD
jgi:hypothetical protein